jgi:hypothetical protein
MKKPRRFPFFASSLVAVLGLAVAPAVRAAETPVDAPVVKLLSPGKDPKKPMRMTAKVGLRRTMVMRMKMAIGENKVPAQKLEIRMTMNLNVTNVSADGDIRYEFKINEFKINMPEVVEDAQTVQAVKVALAWMQGIKGHVIVSSRGFTKEADLVLPPLYVNGVAQTKMDPEIKQFMEESKQKIKQSLQMSSPLPEEAVGVGAKWLTTLTVKQNGMVLKQSITSELRSLSGDAAKVSSTIKQSGMDVDVKSFTSSGNGEMNLDLARLIPSLATVHLTSSWLMSRGQGQDMAMKLDMTMRMQGM